MERSGPVTISRILVPVDGSEPAERALRFATALASPDAEIFLIAVVPRASNVRNVLGQEIAPPEQVQDGYARVAEDHLERAAAQLADNRRVQRLVAIGDPADEILRAAEEHHVDAIVMTRTGQGAWGPSAPERVVDRVVRAARWPVVVVPATGRDGETGRRIDG